MLVYELKGKKAELLSEKRLKFQKADKSLKVAINIAHQFVLVSSHSEFFLFKLKEDD